MSNFDLTYIVLIFLVYFVIPIAQYLTSNQRAKRIIFFVYLFLATGLFIFTILTVISNRDFKDYSEYSSVAELDFVGNPPGIAPGSDLVCNSWLCNQLKGTYTKKNGQIYMSRDKYACDKYIAITKKQPKFPFSYYFVALCLKEKNDDDWNIYAAKAITILEITTTIDGHRVHHDKILDKLRSIQSQ